MRAVVGENGFGGNAHFGGDGRYLLIKTGGAAMQHKRSASQYLADMRRVACTVAMSCYADDHVQIIAQKGGLFNG